MYTTGRYHRLPVTIQGTFEILNLKNNLMKQRVLSTSATIHTYTSGHSMPTSVKP